MRMLSQKYAAPKKAALLKLLGVAGSVFFCLLFLLAINGPSSYGPSVRLPANGHIRAPGPEEMPKPIENLHDGARVWAIRANVDDSLINPVLADAGQLIMDASSLVAACLKEGNGDACKLKVLNPLLPQDGASAPKLFAYAPDYADALDISGHPLRWRMPENIVAGYSLPRPAPFPAPAAGAPVEAPVNPKFARALAKLRPSRNAGDYRAIVDNFAKQFNLSPDLVMAIIHSESNFSPTIVSKRSAMGLMQLLPSTASDEVHRFLYGRRGQVSFAQLSVPEINIHYGTAYLHILNQRYFANVKDNLVREACVIASYNMGPNRFLRLYGSNNQSAVANINSMTPEEFHADLPRRLPVRETRFYVEKVKRMKRHYAGSN